MAFETETDVTGATLDSPRGALLPLLLLPIGLLLLASSRCGELAHT